MELAPTYFSTAESLFSTSRPCGASIAIIVWVAMQLEPSHYLSVVTLHDDAG
jgi:hypothetical protein